MVSDTISCLLHNLKTIWNILMILYSYVEQVMSMCHIQKWQLMLSYFLRYRIFSAIRRGFRPSRMTSNNLISPMKFCYNTNSTLPKQCQSSRSVLQDGSRTFGLFWKEKTPSYNRRNTVFPLNHFRCNFVSAL